MVYFILFDRAQWCLDRIDSYYITECSGGYCIHSTRRTGHNGLLLYFNKILKMGNIFLWTYCIWSIPTKSVHGMLSPITKRKDC